MDKPLTFPSLERQRNRPGKEKGVYESEDMLLTSCLPGFQLSHLMETGCVLEYSSLLENMIFWDVRVERDIRG